MFQNWGFLITEMVVLLILAALIGLIAGWLIFGRRGKVETGGSSAELASCREREADLAAKLAMLQDELATAKAAAAPAPAPTPASASEDLGTKPAVLSAPKNDAPDDLKRINGIGPKLETLCNSLGFYHFDQIAAWTADEVAWVDANLEGFKGRVTRDEWVKQAKALVAEG